MPVVSLRMAGSVARGEFYQIVRMQGSGWAIR